MRSSCGVGPSATGAGVVVAVECLTSAAGVIVVVAAVAVGAQKKKRTWTRYQRWMGSQGRPLSK